MKMLNRIEMQAQYTNLKPEGFPGSNIVHTALQLTLLISTTGLYH